VKILVSLHDVSPRHAQACREILAFLKERGIPPVALLVVPDFHGEWPLDAHPGFVQEIRTWAGLGHELVLHGYFHREIETTAPQGHGLRTWFARKVMTGGEGEFLALNRTAVEARLDQGLALWDRLDLPRPTGFIPPAWLHNEHLDPALAERGIRWTENHAGIRVPGGRAIESPVISWASRDVVRRQGSRIVCPTLARMWHKRDLVRVAIHPHDFDWPQLKASIEGVLDNLARHGTFIDCSAALA
jgi:predicted deacetylase